jgi:hypothetical protein
MRTANTLVVSSGWVGRKGPLGKNGSWTHPEFPGVTVKHCGHQTALRPYYIPGSKLPGGVAYYTFRTVKQAQWWAERGGHLLEDQDEADQLYREMIGRE